MKMRTVIALFVLLVVFAVCATSTEIDFNAVNIPAPPSFLESGMEVDAEAGIDAQAHTEVEADIAAMFESDLNSLTDDSNSLASSNANLAGAAGKAKAVAGAFDSIEFANMPNDKQLPGDIVRLRNAPGAVPLLNEEVLPKSLLPPKGCSDPNHVNDVKLWKSLTKKLQGAKSTLVKYKKWSAVADLAIKKVAAQVQQTTRNTNVVSKAIMGMNFQRRQVVKRLKSYKLKNELEKASKKMEELNEYGRVLGATKQSLVEGNSEMLRKVRFLKRGMKDLQTFGEDS